MQKAIHAEQYKEPAKLSLNSGAFGLKTKKVLQDRGKAVSQLDYIKYKDHKQISHSNYALDILVSSLLSFI